MRPPDVPRLTAHELAVIAREAMPGRPITSVRILGQGEDNTAVVINRRFILRIPKNRRVAGMIRREARLLAALRRRLPIQVPAPERVGGLRSLDGWPVLLYRRIPGSGVSWSRLSPGAYRGLIHDLRPILGQLASFPARLSSQLGVPGRTAGEWRTEMRGFHRYLRRAVFPLIPTDDRAELEARLSGFTENDANFQFRPTLLHTDLHSEHVLWAGHRVSGVIDWGDAEVGDPAREFAQWAAHFGTRDVSRLAENRVGPRDRTFEQRVEVYRLFRPLWRLREAAQTRNVRQAEEGVTWLRRALTIDPSRGWSR